MSLTISSVQNPRVKSAARLRDRKGRDEQGRTIIEGARELFLAIQAGVTISEVYVCSSLCELPEAQAVLAQLDDLDTDVIEVTPMVLEKLAYGERLDGVVAVIDTPRVSFTDWQLPTDAMLAVVDGVEKPGNIGAILRSADAAGLGGVIVTGKGTDLYNPNTIRASLGTIFSVKVAQAEAGETLAWLRQRGFGLYSARVDATRMYDSADYRGPTAFILGSEAHGLANDWHAADITPIRLPMLGLADSLNVSATAAVLFYEARRQRKS